MILERKQKLNALIPQNWSILDIGCARWYIAENIREDVLYSWLDINQAMLEECNSKGINAQYCDLSKWDLPFADNTFDVVFSSHVLEHFYIEQQISIMLECSRVLKKWWKILFYMPTWYHWSFTDDETHRKWHSHASLSALAKDTGFFVNECRYSLTRKFADHLQGKFRLPPIPWYLTEVYIVATNEKKWEFSKEY